MSCRFWEIVITIFSWLCGFILLGTVITIIGFLFNKGIGSVNLSLIFGDTNPIDAILLRQQVFNGLFPAIIGTFLLIIASVSIALPVGICAGIYMAEYSRGYPKKFFTLFFDILAGLPSIIVGLFGFSVTIYLHKNFSANIFPCLLISALSLAFLVLPYLIRTTQTALESLPLNLRNTALTLGATRLQNIIHVLIPTSLPSITNGIILAIGRCAEDTAVIMLTGVVVTAGIPQSFFDNFEALPFYIYYISAQYSTPEELSMGYGAGIILLLICAVLFITVFLIKNLLSARASFARY